MRRSLRRAAAALGAALLAVLPASAARAADQQRAAQWYFAPMKLAEAQKLGNCGEGVVVAVLDSGVDTKHQDLRGATVPGRYLPVDQPDDDIDTGPHGTGIAVLIAGRGHGSGDGLLGVAPRSKVMPLRPIDDPLTVANGIRWAVRNGAKVINMSFNLDSGDTVQKAVDDAVAADVVLVAGVGNDHAAVGEPAALRGVLGVGAVDQNDKVASFSNVGAGVDLVAYGTKIPTAAPRNRYGVSKGTSDATALVSGVVALMRARYPDMSAAEVVDRLTGTATDRGPKGRDDEYGYGQLDAVGALTAPRARPSDSPAVEDSTKAADVPITTTPASESSGIPPLLIVAVGALLLIVALAAFMIVRARRG